MSEWTTSEQSGAMQSVPPPTASHGSPLNPRQPADPYAEDKPEEPMPSYVPWPTSATVMSEPPTAYNNYPQINIQPPLETEIECSTSVEEEIVRFTWKLKDFPRLRFLAANKALHNEENCLESPAYVDRTGSAWWLRVYPFDRSVDGDGTASPTSDGAVEPGNVGVFLHTTRARIEAVSFSVVISVLDKDGVPKPETVASKAMHRFDMSPNERNFGFFDFLAGEAEANSCMIDDNLLWLHCEARIFCAPLTTSLRVTGPNGVPVQQLARAVSQPHQVIHQRAWSHNRMYPSLPIHRHTTASSSATYRMVSGTPTNLVQTFPTQTLQAFPNSTTRVIPGSIPPRYSTPCYRPATRVYHSSPQPFGGCSPLAPRVPAQAAN